MYLNFYELNEKPFNLTPDSNFLFLSEQHKEALAHIKYGIAERKGFLLITGEIGAGKTTLCRTLLSELTQNYKIALILNSMVSAAGLLKGIIADLGIKTKAKTRQDMMDVLSQTVISERNIVIVIDEAQNLTMSALEQVRLLGNFETEKEKLLQIILIGQPELRETISSPRLQQLNQRISVRYHLNPMEREEVEEYINHRLTIAGNKGKITFDYNAIQEIYNYSGGIPRIINVICDYCLVSGYINESFIIDKDMVSEAIKESQGHYIEKWVKTL
jgi:general secretion pathway protein A